MKLDQTDLQILRILQENSKITNLDLSKRWAYPCAYSRTGKKLESHGIIESYHAHVNAQSIGLSVQTFVLVSLAWNKENALDNFILKIQQIPEVVECYIITGEADVIMRLICKDIPSYEKLLFKTLSKIDEIERLKTLMALSTIKSSKLLPFNYEHNED